jgi:hypothetical protein
VRIADTPAAASATDDALIAAEEVTPVDRAN